MHMQNLEVSMLNQVYHHVGKRKIIRRVLKQGICTQVYFMVGDVCAERIEPCGLGITYNVKIVPAVGKPFSKFGGNHATTTKGWVTDNSYIHGA